MLISFEISAQPVDSLHFLPAGATLDVDWRDSRTFATCSQDGTLCLCRLGEAAPVQRFLGHHGEVNAIKWDPSGASWLWSSTADIVRVCGLLWHGLGSC